MCVRVPTNSQVMELLVFNVNVIAIVILILHVTFNNILLCLLSLFSILQSACFAFVNCFENIVE